MPARNKKNQDNGYESSYWQENLSITFIEED
jgi:hypothetical protein